MTTVQLCSDPERCRILWETLWPKESLFDLWPVRACFHRYFDNPLAFLAASENGKPIGLLALSWVKEAGAFVQFPGEIWRGETWLEQNRIPVSSPSIAAELLDHVPGPMRLRYLTRESLSSFGEDAVVDETGYLYYPVRHDFSFEKYWAGFSRKSRGSLESELARFESMGVTYRYDRLSDVGKLLEMNLHAFGESSYFHDQRFLNAFEALASVLAASGILFVTTIMIGGRVAAVDMGGIHDSVYTVLAGGTDPEFPGIDKLINMHHIRRACRERLRLVDFLCGDFGWKERFHLEPRPLYRLDTSTASSRGVY